jgi:hypothetical protein
VSQMAQLLYPRVGPNAYGLDPMLGPKTIRSNKRQAPTYSLRGKDSHGAFFEDLSRVSYMTSLELDLGIKESSLLLGF